MDATTRIGRTVRGITAAAVGSLAMLLTAPPAIAQGTVSGLSLSPPSPAASAPFTVTVQGTGKCKQIQVDFGDGTPAELLDNTDFGASKNDTTGQHAYASAGTYAVSAAGIEQCSGNASKTVNIQTAGGNLDLMLCQISDSCGGPGTAMGAAAGKKMTYMHPVIESMFIGPISPGADVLILGHGFGEGQPEATMKLVDANLTATLSVFDHSDGFVAATIPANLANLMDQPAQIFVKRAGDGELSAGHPVTFKAAREVKMLPAGDPAVKVLVCDDDANVNVCKTGAAYGAAVHAGHANCWGCVGDDAGTDKYSVSLKNGWVVEQLFFSKAAAGVAKEPSFPLDASDVTLPVSWRVEPNDSVIYDMDFAIRGPKGIPW